MPRLDGLESTRRIRAREEDESRARIPIVAMTANARPEDEGRVPGRGDGRISSASRSRWTRSAASSSAGAALASTKLRFSSLVSRIFARAESLHGILGTRSRLRASLVGRSLRLPDDPLALGVQMGSREAPMMNPSNAHPNDYQDIRVRRMDFVFDDAIPTFWFDDNAFLTSLIGGLSVAFPPGERYFISSVKYFLPQVKDSRAAQSCARVHRAGGKPLEGAPRVQPLPRREGLPRDGHRALHHGEAGQGARPDEPRDESRPDSGPRALHRDLGERPPRDPGRARPDGPGGGDALGVACDRGDRASLRGLRRVPRNGR